MYINALVDGEIRVMRMTPRFKAAVEELARIAALRKETERLMADQQAAYRRFKSQMVSIRRGIL